ncbi:hypothetical protein DOE73_04955 [Paenibacillus dendritiformis]|nr:hypothetical protein DOE73_04955 [Paenibacillus dendritiformis]
MLPVTTSGYFFSAKKEEISIIFSLLGSGIHYFGKKMPVRSVDCKIGGGEAFIHVLASEGIEFHHSACSQPNRMDKGRRL